MLGGSGSHNDNIFNRGSHQDYNNFANLTNDPSWRWENILKYFKILENFIGILINENERECKYNFNIIY